MVSLKLVLHTPIFLTPDTKSLKYPSKVCKQFTEFLKIGEVSGISQFEGLWLLPLSLAVSPVCYNRENFRHSPLETINLESLWIVSFVYLFTEKYWCFSCSQNDDQQATSSIKNESGQQNAGIVLWCCLWNWTIRCMSLCFCFHVCNLISSVKGGLLAPILRISISKDLAKSPVNAKYRNENSVY